MNNYYKFSIPYIVIDEPSDVKVEHIKISYTITNIETNVRTEHFDEWGILGPIPFKIDHIDDRTIYKLSEPSDDVYDTEPFTLDDYNTYNYAKSDTGYFIKIGTDPNCIIEYTIDFFNETNLLDLDYLTINRTVDLTASPDSWGGEILYEEDDLDTIAYGLALTFGELGKISPSDFLNTETKENYSILESNFVLHNTVEETPLKINDNTCYTLLSTHITPSDITFPTSLDLSPSADFLDSNAFYDGNKHTPKLQDWFQAIQDIDLSISSTELKDRLVSLKISPESDLKCHLILEHPHGKNIMTLDSNQTRSGSAIFIDDTTCKMRARPASSVFNSISNLDEYDDGHPTAAYPDFSLFNYVKIDHEFPTGTDTYKHRFVSVNNIDDIDSGLYSQKMFMSNDNDNIINGLEEVVFNTRLKDQELLVDHKAKVRTTINTTHGGTIDSTATISNIDLKLSVVLSESDEFHLINKYVVDKNYIKKYWNKFNDDKFPSTVSGEKLCENAVDIYKYTYTAKEIEQSDYLKFNNCIPIHTKSCVSSGQETKTNAESIYGMVDFSTFLGVDHPYSDFVDLEPGKYYLLIAYINDTKFQIGTNAFSCGWVYENDAWIQVSNSVALTSHTKPSEMKFYYNSGLLTPLRKLAMVVTSTDIINRTEYFNPLFFELSSFDSSADPKDIDIIGLSNKPLSSLCDKVQDATILEIPRKSAGEKPLNSYYIPPAIFNIIGNEQTDYPPF